MSILLQFICHKTAEQLVSAEEDHHLTSCLPRKKKASCIIQHHVCSLIDFTFTLLCFAIPMGCGRKVHLSRAKGVPSFHTLWACTAKTSTPFSCKMWHLVRREAPAMVMLCCMFTFNVVCYPSIRLSIGFTLLFLDSAKFWFCSSCSWRFQ